LTTLNGHTSSVLSATYSPDGRKIASSSWNKQIKVWNAETGVELATITGHKGVVTQVRFTHDGRHIVSCSLDKTVRVFSADTYTEITAIKAHSEVCHCANTRTRTRTHAHTHTPNETHLSATPPGSEQRGLLARWKVDSFGLDRQDHQEVELGHLGRGVHILGSHQCRQPGCVLARRQQCSVWQRR
jgi:WD40 repeat protein